MKLITNSISGQLAEAVSKSKAILGKKWLASSVKVCNRDGSFFYKSQNSDLFSLVKNGA